jgi:hypothetical protein
MTTRERESNHQGPITESPSALEKLVIGEIEGKNRAIHTYDDVVWKIRTGFMTLLFGSWAILLKAVVESSASLDAQHRRLILALLIFSAGFAIGAAYIDRTYVRRKFRVILALDSLTAEVQQCSGDLRRIAPSLLQVAGDNGDAPYKCSGYRQALKGELMVYAVPLAALLLGIALTVW